MIVGAAQAEAQSCPLERSPELVSISQSAALANGRSELPSINFDGCFVAFKSAATNLVSPDPNGSTIEVFVRDRGAGVISRIPSETANGNPPSEESFAPTISADSIVVAFASAAPNLVLGDFNQRVDAFTHNRVSGLTEILSLVSDNGQGRLGGLVLDSRPATNVDGNLVAFVSSSGSLVDNDDNETNDVFLVDRSTGEIELITVTNLGAPGERSANDLSAGAAISADGRYVAFCSEATNLVDGGDPSLAGIYLRDREQGVTERIATLSRGRCQRPEFAPSLAAFAEVLLFVSDKDLGFGANGSEQVYARRSDASIVHISRSPSGGLSNVGALNPSVSEDGRFAAFQSNATNLVDGDLNDASDVFIVRTSEPGMIRVSLDDRGLEGAGDSFAPTLSGDGSIIAFHSDAQLSRDDTNAFRDVYVAQNTLHFTPTPTITATPTVTETPLAPTVTATETRLPPTVTPVPPATFTQSATATSSIPPTSTPKATNTVPVASGTGGGGGCSCEVDPHRESLNMLPISMTLLLPMALLALSSRRRRLGSLENGR